MKMYIKVPIRVTQNWQLIKLDTLILKKWVTGATRGHFWSLKTPKTMLMKMPNPLPPPQIETYNTPERSGLCSMLALKRCIFTLESEVKWKSFSHVRLCDPMDYAVHGILQAGILEWVAVPFFRGSSHPRDWTKVSHIMGRFFTSWATREA